MKIALLIQQLTLSILFILLHKIEIIIPLIHQVIRVKELSLAVLIWEEYMYVSLKVDCRVII